MINTKCMIRVYLLDDDNREKVPSQTAFIHFEKQNLSMETVFFPFFLFICESLIEV